MPRGRKDKGEGAQMDALYSSDDFRMYCFKVLPCSKHYCHDWTECPFAHPGEKARRRDPRVFPHVGIECPQGSNCPRGDLCPFAHNVFECWLHPTRYRTQLCNEPASCRRKVCFFAHTVEELREPTGGIDPTMDPSMAAAAAGMLPPGTDQQSGASAPNVTAPSTTGAPAVTTHASEPKGAGGIENTDVDPALAATLASTPPASVPAYAPAKVQTPPPTPAQVSGSAVTSNNVAAVPPRPSRSSTDSLRGSRQRTTPGGAWESASGKRTSLESNKSAKEGRGSFDTPRNGQRSQSASFEGKKTKSKSLSRLSADIPRHNRQVKQQEQESNSATVAQLQQLRNQIQAQQLGISTDITAALDQLSLSNPSVDQIGQQQIQQLQQQVFQTLGAGANVAQNDRVVQLFMMLLKEISDTQAQAQRPADFNPARTSLDSTFSVGSGVPGGSVSSERFSVDGFVPTPYSMQYGAGGLVDPASWYMPASSGRVSTDGVPDFILHDSRPRDPSLDSTFSDTMNAHYVARMSIDSGYESSVVSGGSSEQRNVSVDGGIANLNLGARGYATPPGFDPFNQATLPPTNVTPMDSFAGASFPQGLSQASVAPQILGQFVNQT